MAEPDFPLSAGLDHSSVLQAFEEIEKASRKMESSGQQDLQELGTAVNTLLNSQLRAAAELAKDGGDTFASAFGKGAISSEDFRKKVQQLASEMRKLSGDLPTVGAIGEEEQILSQEAFVRLERFDELFSRVFEHGSQEAQNLGRSLQDTSALAEVMFSIGIISAEEFNDVIRQTETRLKRLASGVEVPKLDFSEPLKLDVAQKQMEALQDAAQEFLESGDDELEEFGQNLQAQLEGVRDEFGQDLVDPEAVKQIRSMTTAVNQFQKAAGEKVDPLNEQIQAQQAELEIRKLEQATKAMIESGIPQAQMLGQTLHDAGARAALSFRNGEISAEEFLKEVRNLNTAGNKAASSFKKLGEDVSPQMDQAEKSTRRATGSIWRLGSALDHVGARGAGSVIRVVDAFRAIPPVAVGAALAIGGITIVISKVARAAIEMGKKVTKAFFEISKGSVLIAEDLELVERQLTNIFRGKPELAKATLREIQRLSVDLGVDLTQDVARIILPIVHSMEQFERAAQQISTIAIAFGRTEEETSRAVKQAVAGHFRPLQEQFGLLGTDIELIKQLQEEFGALEGVIRGLDQYARRSGQEWDTYEGTLRRVRGSIEQWRRLAGSILGEPIKIALTEQLQNLLDFIDDHEDDIEKFLAGIGDVVGNFVTTVGEISFDFFGDLDTSDFEELINAFDELLTDIAGLGRQVFPTEGAGGFLGVAVEIVNTIDAAVVETRKLIAAWLEIKQTVSDVGDTIESLPLPGNIGAAIGERLGTTEILPGFFRLVTGKALREEAVEQSGLNEIFEEEDRLLQERTDARNANTEAIINSTDALEDERDAALDLHSTTEELRQQIAAAKDAQEEWNEAMVDFAKDNAREIEDLEIELGQRRVDIAIDRAQKIIDAEQDFQREMEKLQRKHGDRLLDARIEAGDDSLDNFIDYQRDLTELEIEASQEREDREVKHQNRLKDIRQRFAFDAQEALRQNDAVRFLQIKRRMEFELSEEKEKHEEETEQAVKEEERKREKLQRQYEYEEEDLTRHLDNKLRDLKRQLDREIREERIKHQQSLEDIDTWEARKLDELRIWEKRQTDAMILERERSLEDLRDKYADQLEAMRQGEEAKLQLAIQYATQIRNVINSAFNLVGGAGGTSGRFPGGSPYTGPYQNPYQGAGQSPYGGPYDYTPTGNQGGGGGTYNLSLDELRDIAEETILAADWLSEAQQTAGIAGLMTMSAEQLIRLIEDLGGEVPQTRHQGGMVSTGKPYAVMPNEAFIPTQNGLVAGQMPMMFSPGAGQAGNTVYDYSRPIQADISMNDPSQMSPVQITMIRKIVTEEILKDAVQ